VEGKLEEYPAPAKIIIYSSSIVTTQEVSNALGCHAYYRDVGDAAVKDEIWKAWESVDVQCLRGGWLTLLGFTGQPPTPPPPNHPTKK
jgi:hypothetical protein